MNKQHTTSNTTTHLRRLTFREMYANRARSEAFAYAWENRNDLARVEQRIRDKEEIFSDSLISPEPSGLVTSVSAYREGFLPGLKDARDCLSLYQVDEHENGIIDTKLVGAIYRSILESEARSEAFRFAWTHIDDLNSIRDWAGQVELSKPDLFLVKVKELVIRTDEGDRIHDENLLRNSLSEDKSLGIYYQAYLKTLNEIL